MTPSACPIQRPPLTPNEVCPRSSCLRAVFVLSLIRASGFPVAHPANSTPNALPPRVSSVGVVLRRSACPIIGLLPALATFSGTYGWMKSKDGRSFCYGYSHLFLEPAGLQQSKREQHINSERAAGSWRRCRGLECLGGRWQEQHCRSVVVLRLLRTLGAVQDPPRPALVCGCASRPATRGRGPGPYQI